MQKAENSERPQVGRRVASGGEGRKPGRVMETKGSEGLGKKGKGDRFQCCPDTGQDEGMGGDLGESSVDGGVGVRVTGGGRVER